MIALATCLAAVACWLLVSPDGEPRLHVVLPPAQTPRRRLGATTVAWLASASAAAGVLMLAPGAVGAVVALGCLVILPRAVARLETREQRKTREDLARQAPMVVDLLAATLASGAPMGSALTAVRLALDPPASHVLAPIVSAMELGADAADAWASVIDDPVLGSVATAVVRSARTGAPLVTTLSRLAEDLRRERRTVVDVAARTAGIRAVVPLAACFLPAFVLLGVVPVVAALATGLLDS